MSVAPDDPFLLDQHRRPPEFGGSGKDPLWEIADDQLPVELSFFADFIDHGVIQPARVMPLANYESALVGTRELWKLLP